MWHFVINNKVKNKTSNLKDKENTKTQTQYKTGNAKHIEHKEKEKPQNIIKYEILELKMKYETSENAKQKVQAKVET